MDNRVLRKRKARVCMMLADISSVSREGGKQSSIDQRRAASRSVAMDVPEVKHSSETG